MTVIVFSKKAKYFHGFCSNKLQPESTDVRHENCSVEIVPVIVSPLVLAITIDSVTPDPPFGYIAAFSITITNNGADDLQVQIAPDLVGTLDGTNVGLNWSSTSETISAGGGSVTVTGTAQLSTTGAFQITGTVTGDTFPMATTPVVSNTDTEVTTVA